MVSNPPENMPRIAPYLFYEDVAAAIDWLTDAFGFKERSRIKLPDGAVGHAELEYQDGVILVGWPGSHYRNPNAHGKSNGLTYVFVDDVDAHYRHAKAAGATIIEEPADQFYGDRRYFVADLEGNLWNFATHTRDVPAGDQLPQ